MNKKGVIAIVYDFDGTLSPRPMQEYTVLPEAGLTANQFWEEVKTENTRNEGEEIITYMMLMLKKANEKSIKITKKDLGGLAGQIEFYKGVPSFFPRITEYVEDESRGKAQLRHYIISSGLKEILRKLSIRKYFHNIFASRFVNL